MKISSIAFSSFHLCTSVIKEVSHREEIIPIKIGEICPNLSMNWDIIEWPEKKMNDWDVAEKPVRSEELGEKSFLPLIGHCFQKRWQIDRLTIYQPMVWDKSTADKAEVRAPGLCWIVIGTNMDVKPFPGRITPRECSVFFPDQSLIRRGWNLGWR